MNWKKWLHGLWAAVISGSVGAIGAVGGMAATGADHIDYGPLGGALVGGALSGAIAYLKQSPLPPVNGSNTTPGLTQPPR